MKNRMEFTYKLSILLKQMADEGERVILDYVKRSVEEQRRLFEKGLSKCDGVNIPSRHQSGMAADIYFETEDYKMLEDPQLGWEFWHEEWEELGGKPIIMWDKNHFEG